MLSLTVVTEQFRELPRYAKIADEVYRLYVEEKIKAIVICLFVIALLGRLLGCQG